MRCTACARLRDAAAQEAAGAGEPEEAQEAAQEAAGAGEGTREHLRDEVDRLTKEVHELRQRVEGLEVLMREWW